MKVLFILLILLCSCCTLHGQSACDAEPSISRLWPPNGQLVSLDVIAEPGVVVTITSVKQDEPLNKGPDRPNKSIFEMISEMLSRIFGMNVGDMDDNNKGNADAVIVDANTVRLRKERLGNGNGRVYHIFFMADDGVNSPCEGEVTVCVPKSQGRGNGNNICVDGGALYTGV